GVKTVVGDRSYADLIPLSDLVIELYSRWDPQRAGAFRLSLVSFQFGENLWDSFCACRLGDRHPLARLSDYRQPAGHANGAERTGGVLVAWDSKSSPRSPLLHDCYLRVVRVRELKFHWDSDRRNRCARAKQERGTGASRSTSHV